MGARPRSWWQTIRKPLAVVGFIVACALGIALIVGIIGGYLFNWGWAGLGRKTLWDWLQLIFIPAVLTLGAIWYTARQSHDREIMLDNQRETALQTYIDKIPVYKLAEPELTGTKEQIILRARTLALLPSMDANRKRTLLQFLYELHLICIPDRVHPKYPIIKLSTADLSGANLTNLNLVSMYNKVVNPTIKS
jgi:hypothetical protein